MHISTLVGDHRSPGKDPPHHRSDLSLGRPSSSPSGAAADPGDGVTMETAVEIDAIAARLTRRHILISASSLVTLPPPPKEACHHSIGEGLACLAGKTATCVRQSARFSSGLCQDIPDRVQACQCRERNSKPWLLLFFQQPPMECIAHQCGATRQVEFGHQPRLVGLDRLDAEAEHVGRLLVGVAQGD